MKRYCSIRCERWKCLLVVLIDRRNVNTNVRLCPSVGRVSLLDRDSVTDFLLFFYTSVCSPSPFTRSKEYSNEYSPQQVSQLKCDRISETLLAADVLVHGTRNRLSRNCTKRSLQNARIDRKLKFERKRWKCNCVGFRTSRKSRFAACSFVLTPKWSKWPILLMIFVRFFVTRDSVFSKI